MATNNDRLQAFLDGHPDIEIFEIILPDVCGGLRGKWVTRDKIHKLIQGELKLPLTSLAFDVWGRDAEALVFETGDGDGFCEADVQTLVPVPWLEQPTAQVIVSMRIPADSPRAARIEHCVAGADANPYLVIAAILSGMLHGIENKLAAPAPLEGNAYEQLPPSLPRYWPDALARFETSDFIRDNFSEEFQRVYAVLKQQELDEFDRQVTPLEYDACL